MIKENRILQKFLIIIVSYYIKDIITSNFSRAKVLVRLVDNSVLIKVIITEEKGYRNGNVKFKERQI